MSADPKYTLEERLEYATTKLNAAMEARDRADALYESAHELGGGIPGFGGSGNQRAAQKVRSAHDRAYRAGTEADERVAFWRAKVLGYKRRIDERDRVPLTRDDILGATHVRLGRIWYAVVRVNQKTVTVRGLWPWDEPVSFHKVEEARTVGGAA